MSSLAVIILAGGKGTRLKNSIAKPLVTIAGTTSVGMVIEAALALHPKQIQIVVGFQAEDVEKHIKNHHSKRINEQSCTLGFSLQEQQLGTANAVEVALSEVKNCSRILVLYADSPLLRTSTLSNAVQSTSTACFLGAELQEPFGYGRVLLNDENKIEEIVEENEASEEQKTISLINSGVLAIEYQALKSLLKKIDNNNSKKEYYLTDIPKYHDDVAIVFIEDPREILGFNNLKELIHARQTLNAMQVDALIALGVDFADPFSVKIESGPTLPKIGNDCFIDNNVILRGSVEIGNRVSVGANCIILDSSIGDDCQIYPYSFLDNATLSSNAQVGPYARLRPGSVLRKQSKVGNFVEVKNSTIEKDAKVNHLSYIGDAIIGERTNIGAGTITCNYDGKEKHKTNIGKDVFVGSGVELVAPITVEDSAKIGAGTTVRKNVKKGSLVVGQPPQKIFEKKKDE